MNYNQNQEVKIIIKKLNENKDIDNQKSKIKYLNSIANSTSVANATFSKYGQMAAFLWRRFSHKSGLFHSEAFNLYTLLIIASIHHLYTKNPLYTELFTFFVCLFILLSPHTLHSAEMSLAFIMYASNVCNN